MSEIALVTGASGGIGAAVAQKLAQEGYFVLIHGYQHMDQAQDVLKTIEQQGGKGAVLCFNIASEKEVNTKIQEAIRTHGPVSVLVNNAGVTQNELFLRFQKAHLERIFSINVYGALYSTYAVLKTMLKKRDGRIVFLSSVVAQRGNAGQTLYAASKAALIGFAKSLALELASRNIRINVVAPGFIQTAMTEVLTDTQKEAILQSIPLRFFGKPVDIAEAVSFLVSPKNRYVTGQVFGVNGGLWG